MTNLLLIAALSIVMFAGLQVVPSQASAGDEARNTTAEKSIYDFTVKDIDGEEVKLSKYKGGVLLIVNVASK